MLILTGKDFLTVIINMVNDLKKKIDIMNKYMGIHQILQNKKSANLKTDQ